MVARGSRFLGPCGFRADLFRLPWRGSKKRKRRGGIGEPKRKPSEKEGGGEEGSRKEKKSREGGGESKEGGEGRG